MKVRLDPSELNQKTREVLRERSRIAAQARACEKTTNRLSKASPKERDRVWDVLIERALQGERIAIFEKLNPREVDFVQRLGFECRDQGKEDITSFIQSHLDRLEGELEFSRERIRQLEKDVLEPNELKIASEKNTYRRLKAELEELKTKNANRKPILFWSIDLNRRRRNQEVLVDYDARWIDWLLIEGQKFLKAIEMALATAASCGDRWEIFKVENHVGQLSRQLEYSENGPWTAHRFFLEDSLITFHGPHPLVFRYFMEVLGYTCSIRWSQSSAMVRVSW
jgi:hypothetical protein